MPAELCRHSSFSELGKWLPDYGRSSFPRVGYVHHSHVRDVWLRRRIQQQLAEHKAAREARRRTVRYVALRQLEQTFTLLANRWARDTAHLSSSPQTAMDPSYQQIIGLGRPAIPLILRRLQRRSDHWFWALRSITGENPVAPADVGDLDKMRRAWLRWGTERGLI